MGTVKKASIVASKKAEAPKARVVNAAKQRIKNTKPVSATQLAEPVAYYQPYKVSVASSTKQKGMVVMLKDAAANRPESQMTAIEKMAIARLGVTKKDLEGLKHKALLDYDDLAQVLAVTRATLINKKKEEKFSAAISERIVGLADIYSYGYEVFEDEQKFNDWMFRPNSALAGEVPYSLMDNQYGREELRNIIGRIAYGVYS